jgi:serine phosphatase RsbU (regulator of sigma subunit)
MRAVRQRLRLSPGDLFDELLAEVKHFSSQKEFEDDVCLIGMEIKNLGAFKARDRK